VDADERTMAGAGWIQRQYRRQGQGDEGRLVITAGMD